MSTENFSASFVIVGGGIAGITCAEQLALELPVVDILVISASPLIKAVTNIKKTAQILEEFNVEERSYSTIDKKYPNIQVIVDSVISLNADNHILKISNGQCITYKKLCLCAGGIPKVIQCELPYVIGIRDTHTIQTFQKKLSGASRVMVVGNGGIATELVYEIEGCEIIWAVKNQFIGATFFDAGAAEFLLPHLGQEKTSETTILKRMKYSQNDKSSSLESSCSGSSLGPDWSSDIRLKGKLSKGNVNVQLDCEVKAIYTAEELPSNLQVETHTERIWPIYVELSNSACFGCDFVVSATGVEPCTKTFLLGNKFLLAPDGGLQVNSQMLTSEVDVYAAGDICTPSWQWAKHWFQMRLWTQARQMGAFAAKCMAANYRNEDPPLQDICFDLFTHVTQFFGYKVVLLGLFNGQKLNRDYEILLRVTKGQEYVKVILQEGKMQGALLIGETDLEEVFENLILNALDLTHYGEDLLNPNVDIEDYFD